MQNGGNPLVMCMFSGMGALGGHCLQICPTDQNVKLDLTTFF